MGRLKELRTKQSKGTLDEAEKKELAELEADIKETDETDTTTGEGTEETDEEKAIEDLATKLASSLEDKVKTITDKLQDDKSSKVEVSHEAKFIVDPQLGRVPVEKLDEVKIEIADRKAAGKKFYEVTKRTIHFIQALATSDREKLQTLTEGTGAQGGFLVPEEFVNILVEDRRDLTVMRQLATVLPVSTDTIHIPNLATRPKAFWRSEAAVKSTTTVTFGETVLTPYSLAAIATLSNELVADASLGVSGSIVNLVSNLIARAIAEEEDKAFWTGNGTGRPTGVDNYTFVTISGGVTDTTRADALIQALFTLPQGYRGSAAIVANKNTLSKIFRLKDTQNRYLLDDLQSGPTFTIRGRPVYEQNDIGDGKAFVGDFSFYYIADRQGITVDVSREATVASQSAFERNLTHVRVEERVDGELTLTQPIVELSSMGGA